MTRALWERPVAFVGGAWVDVDRSRAVVDPATEQPIGTAADCDPALVDAAVRAAASAAASWGQTPAEERASAIARLHTELVRRREQLVDTIVAEVGAPLRTARDAHVDVALDVLRWYAEQVDPGWFEYTIGNSRVVRQPAGVAACITPWNYPLYQLVVKLAPALLAGCPVVIKPAELAPLTAYLLVDAAVDAALPPGVVNLVPGSGAETGDALVRHPLVALISFTGSTAVGRQVASLAALRCKRVGLELGGKSASIVLDGAPLETAVRATVDSATLNSGQTCSAWTRLLVPASRYEEAVSLAGRDMAALVVGDPRDVRTDLGPLISAEQRRRVHDLVDRASAVGARIIRADRALPAVGYFTEPVVVADVDATTEIAREEVFGPVLTLLPHHGQEDAIASANASPYGLGGAVWAATEAQGLAVARRLRTGQVDVNGAEFNLAAPFGGFGASGTGRELGLAGLEEYTELQAIQT
ncbi:aldehyde dehydrogenase family protein [Egicoccus sp. AB-alg2]|uniref:aldehyde dehydrogenase family protein n=1 Tax=Egicoccus sp. AB-alg2 TaxID=3242693 RepID=UPI00359D6957